MRSSYFKIIIIALIISFLGILAIYSSTYQKDSRAWQAIYQRQILWIIIGLAFFFILAESDYRRLEDLAYILYLLSVFFLLLVFILGVIRLGAQRWLKVGWFNFQPSELAKLATVIFMAKYFSRKSVDEIYLSSGRFGLVRGLLIPLFFIGISMGLIIEQPDLGSGMLVMILFISMLYVTNLKLIYFIGFVSILAAPAPLLWHFLRDYQKERLMVFLNPNIDPLGAGYTIIQSKIAIGSAGWFGKGWLSGTQSQLHFLPESHTDFIFATFSEEWGFLGSMFLILLYYFLIREGFKIAERTHDYFGRLLAMGISLMFSIQVCINIAMNLGLAPVVGVPLPLFSYGGSSVFITFISLAILASIDKNRSAF
jgi:rod shape determining protein RodA